MSKKRELERGEFSEKCQDILNILILHGSVQPLWCVWSNPKHQPWLTAPFSYLPARLKPFPLLTFSLYLPMRSGILSWIQDINLLIDGFSFYYLFNQVMSLQIMTICY